MAGFSEATADSRIRKYESDAMALKAAIRQRIADALEVDLSALSDIDISTNEDVIHALFQLEESFGLEIEKKDGKTYFNFKDDNSEMQTLNTFMNIWSDQKKVLLPDPQNVTEEQMKAYERWKARFIGNASRNLNYIDADPGYIAAVIEPISSASEDTQILLAKFRAELDNLADLGLQIIQRFR